MPARHISVLRSATEADEPITCSISCASDEMRLHDVARATVCLDRVHVARQSPTIVRRTGSRLVRCSSASRADR